MIEAVFKDEEATLNQEDQEKCLTPYAPSAIRKQKFLSNRRKEDLFIAGIVTPSNETTTKGKKYNTKIVSGKRPFTSICSAGCLNPLFLNQN
jgi:uncharacterized protein VirK/YbjX